MDVEAYLKQLKCSAYKANILSWDTKAFLIDINTHVHTYTHTDEQMSI